MQSTSSYATIKALMPIFATHGLPERIVTDNGPQFCSEEFSEFLKTNGINHTRSAPYHPSTNGEAERFVQTFKHNMKCRQATASNVICHISKFLLSYRTTEHGITGQTPSQMLMSRRIRTKFDLLSPDFQAQQNLREWKQLEKHHKVPTYAPSTPVMVRSYTTPEKWVPGIVSSNLGNMHYDVTVGGKVTRRHVDQLKPSSVHHDQDLDRTEDIPQDSHSSPDVDTTDSTTASSDAHDTVDEPPSGRVLPPRKNRGVPPDRLDL